MVGRWTLVHPMEHGIRSWYRVGATSTVTNTQMCGFFAFFLFFFAVEDSASGSCFGFRHGHPLPMADVALPVLWRRLAHCGVNLG
jgi:hypothetical protein